MSIIFYDRDASGNYRNLNNETTRYNRLLYNSTSNLKEVSISTLTFTSGTEHTIHTFTGLQNSKLYQVCGYICIKVYTSNLSFLHCYTRIEDTGGGGYSYTKIFSKSGADVGQELYIQLNDNVRSSNTGSIIVKICCVFSGGSVKIENGIIFPMLIENY